MAISLKDSLFSLRARLQSRIWRLQAYIWVLAMGLIFLLALPLLPRQLDSFEVDVTTDTLSVIVSPDAPAWPVLEGASTISGEYGGCEPIRFRPSLGALIQVYSNGAGRPSVIVYSDGSAGAIDCSDLSTRAADVDIEYSLLTDTASASSHLLKVDGQVTLGSDGDLDDLSPFLLRDGRVTVNTTPMPFLSASTRVVHDFTVGDRVQFLATRGEEKNTQSRTVGFVLFKPGLPARFIGKTEASVTSIVGFGVPERDAVVFGPSFLSRLQSSAEYILLVPVGWILWQLAVTYLRLIRKQTPQEREMETRAKLIRRVSSARKLKDLGAHGRAVTPKEKSPHPSAANKALIGLAAAAAFTLLGTSSSEASAAEVGLIEGSSTRGQALIFEVDGVCSALTANHVLDGREAVLITLSDRKSLTAEVRTTIGDIALLQISRDDQFDCPEWNYATEIDGYLSGNSFQAITVDRMGLNRISLAIRQESEGYLVFAPAFDVDKERLEKGISGSAVFSRKQPLGIITAVDPYSGELSVVRMDAIVKLFASAFAPGSKQQSAMRDGETGADQSQPKRNAFQPNSPIGRPTFTFDKVVHEKKVRKFLLGEGVFLQTDTTPSGQAMRNFNAMLNVEGDKMVLSRVDFTIVNDYLENQPLGGLKIEGKPFSLCSYLENRATKKRGITQCIADFRYRSNESFYTTGSFSAELEYLDICDAQTIFSGNCSIWIYVFPSWEKISGAGGSFNLNALIALGRLIE